MPVEFNAENLMHFIDWSRSEPYKVSVERASAPSSDITMKPPPATLTDPKWPPPPRTPRI